MTSGRQRVDTRGWWLTNDLEALCCNVCPRAGCQSVHKAASLPFPVHDAGNGWTCNRDYWGQAPPPVCLPSTIWHHCTWQDLPGLPCPYLHTTSDQRVVVGNVQGTGLICHTMVVVLLIICLLLHRYWYHYGCLFPDMGTVFIAIDKCDRENGCLKVRVGLTQRRWLTQPTIHGWFTHNPALWTCRTCSLSESDLWCPTEICGFILIHNYVELCIVEMAQYFN